MIGNLTAGVRYQARVARSANNAHGTYMKCPKLWLWAVFAGYRRHQRTVYCLHVSCPYQVLLPDDNGKLQPLTHPQGRRRGTMPSRSGVLIKACLRAGHRHVTRCTVPDFAAKKRRETYGLVVVEPGNLRQLMIPERSACWRRLRC